MSDPLNAISTRRTPQTQQADPRQAVNHQGGYTFVIDDLARLHRFLTLGSTGGTYYATEREHTLDNAQLVLDLARTRTLDVVNQVVAVSVAGRAPKQNPALFALAAAAKLGDDEGRKAALSAVPLVARTGTHMFILAGYLEQFGGWGRGTRRAIGNWYADRPIADVAYQAVKYRQREGWTHADLLRLSHPKTSEQKQLHEIDAELARIYKADSPDAAAHARARILTDQRPEVERQHKTRRGLFDWISGRDADLSGLVLVEAFEQLQKAGSVGDAVTIVSSNPGISWEMIPDQFLNETKIWDALLHSGLPQTALMRQLPRLTRLGLLDPLGSWTGEVVRELTDPERLRKGRVHPINVLVAQRTYASGQSARGDSTWSPSRPIVDALDQAFYNAFAAVEPSNKRHLLALDVSASMTAACSGLPLTCREATAALSLVTAATEPATSTIGFTAGSRGDGGYSSSRTGWGREAVVPLSISPRQRLDDAIRAVSNLPYGGTDCALPMLYARDRGLEVDTFVVYTDNETAHGQLHPHQALREYREATGIDAKLVVVAMTATEFSIADPSDPGMLDISGFDSAVPGLIGDFARGL